MQPHVTIVLPVYNVEPYLRECLDSVVNQTMREIQIICVNDGSTDGSPAILEEYAAKDPRILVIHQENQGAGSARNAAFPHIQGKYTYFVDPDDWIDLQLCEKLYKYAEETQAEIVFLGYQRQNDTTKRFIRGHKHISDNKNLPLEERKKIFFRVVSTVCKFWNSHFLLSHRITFAPGKRSCNDVLQNWKGVFLAQRIEVIDEKLYYYRMRPDSYQTNNDHSSKIVLFRVYDEIKEFLIHSGCYDQYRDFYLFCKLTGIYSRYVTGSLKLRQTLFKMALDHFDEELYLYSQKSSCLDPKILFCRTVFAKKRKRIMPYFYFSTLLLIYTRIRQTVSALIGLIDRFV